MGYDTTFKSYLRSYLFITNNIYDRMEKDIVGLSLLRFDLWIFPGTVNISTYGLYGIEFENPRIGGLFERTAFIRVVEEDSKNSYFEFTRVRSNF